MPLSFSVNSISAPETFAALLAAFGLGALHSFEPGHAKGLMVAYFIGHRRRISDAVALGIIVTIAHTLSVLALALVMRVLATQFPSEQIEARSQLMGGLVVMGFGIWMLVRLRRRGELFRPQTHDHDHDCPYPHRHDEKQEASLGQLFTVGLACGLVPCAPGLALLPASVGAGNLALGIWLVVAFSAGIGAVVIGLGVLVCKAQTLAERFFGSLDAHAKQIQLGSAVVVLVVGLIFSIRAALAL